MKKQTFYKTFLNIALPITIQNFITSSLNLVDTLMIGGLGEGAIAAVGVANRLFFFFIVSVFGIYSACGIFSAQYWGKNERANVHKVMGVMLTLGLIFSSLFILVALLLPSQYMYLFSRDQEVISLGVAYLRVVAPSYILTAISFMYAYTSRSIHMTKYPMYISVMALSVNTLLNYILIYGHFGMPALGVMGAAMATSIARVLELVAFLIVIYKLVDHPLRVNIKSMMSYTKSLVMNIIKKGMPVFVNELTWALGNTLYFVAYGLLGKSALATVQVANTIADIFISLFMGLSSASSVMIGNALGNREYQKAELYSKKFINIVILLAGIVSVCLIALAFIVPSFYDNFSAETSRALTFTLIVIAFYQIPKMYNYIVVIGVLRSGGDTVFCMILDLVGVWFIGVPMAFFVAITFSPPIYVVVGAAYFEEIVKNIPAYIRVKRKKWIKNIVDDI